MKCRTFTAASLACLITTGCATMSEDQCRMADWYEVGLADGRAGHSDLRLGKHAEACASVGIRPDADAWRAGRRDGLMAYCTAESGWRIGQTGASYHQVCDPEGEADFLFGYEIGKELHDVGASIHDLENRIAAVNRQLDDTALDEDDRHALRDELERLNRQIRNLERQRGDAEAEARNRGFRNVR